MSDEKIIGDGEKQLEITDNSITIEAILKPVDTRPIWERAVWRKDDTGRELCCLEPCTVNSIAKHLCMKHYQAMRRGQLDAESGLNKSEVAAIASDGKPKIDLSSSFEGFDKYVYIYGENYLLGIDTDENIPMSHAVAFWGKELRAAIKDGRIKGYYREVFDAAHPGKHDRNYNSYKHLEKLDGKNIGEALDPRLDELITNLGGKDKDYLINWIAHKIQNPSYVDTALVIHGGQGAGKNVLGEVLKAIFAPHVMTINAHSLENEFNAWQERKFLIIADEITTKSLRERERTKNILKTYVVPGPIHINKKGVNQFEIINCASWMIFSNSTHPVDIEPGDRRFSVLNAPKALRRMLGADIIKHKAQLSDNLVNYCLGVNLTQYAAGTPLENDARSEVKEHSAPPPKDDMEQLT